MAWSFLALLLKRGATTATYTAPNPVTAETVVKIVIPTSVDFPNQSATLTVAVEPPPTDYNYHPSNGDPEQRLQRPGDCNRRPRSPLSWSISAGTLPAGLTLSSKQNRYSANLGQAHGRRKFYFHNNGDGRNHGASSSQQLTTIVVSSLCDYHHIAAATREYNDRIYGDFHRHRRDTALHLVRCEWLDSSCGSLAKQQHRRSRRSSNSSRKFFFRHYRD